MLDPGGPMDSLLRALHPLDFLTSMGVMKITLHFSERSPTTEEKRSQ